MSDSGEGDKFQVVRYPMVAEENEPYRLKGETLHPERYSADSAERIKRAVGPRVWNALYQQNPVPDTGSYYTNEMFHYYDDRPRRLRIYAAFDLAVSKADRADFTVGIVVGVDKAQDIYILDLVRGRWDANEIVDQLLKVHKIYQPDAIGVERGTIQLALKPFMDKRLREEGVFDLHLKLLTPGKRDKEARGRNIQGRMKQGRVFWPRQASWLEPAQRELLQFPLGSHDDVPDTLAYIGLMLTDMTAPPSSQRDKLASWRENLDQFMAGSKTVKSFMGA
jgi:predicted phage terminase large subunit-like protein